MAALCLSRIPGVFKCADTMSEKRRIRFQGEELGEFSIRQAMRGAERGEIDHTAEYWSEREKKWRKLPSFIDDFADHDPLDDMKRAGIKKAQVLGADEADCPACKSIQKQIFPIDATPELPPENCTCIPWCRCCLIAAK